MANSNLSGALCGMTYTKACDLLWKPIKNSILESPWYSYLHEKLTYYEEYHGLKLYNVHSNALSYNFRQIFLHPTGPNKRTLRGDTRFLSVLDELGWFPHGEDNDERERASANEVYVALDRSLKTVRAATRRSAKQGYNNLPFAYSLNISSPSSYYDKIMSLFRTYQNARDVYAWKLATWEMNPTFSEDDFGKEYLEDPIKADRDFGANPPKSQTPWIEESEALRPLFEVKNKISYTYKHSISPSGRRQRYAELHGNKSVQTSMPTVMALDAGYSHDSMALCLARLTPKTYKTEQRIEICGLVEVSPLEGDCVLDYSRIGEELIKPLVLNSHVKLVLSDRWQSLKFLSDLEKECGVFTEQISLTGAYFEWIKDCLLTASIEDTPSMVLPKPEKELDEIEINDSTYPECFRLLPSAHLQHQLFSAEVDHRGVVRKSRNVTDDLLRTAVMALYVLSEESWVKWAGLNVIIQSKRAADGVAWKYNGGGFNIQQGSELGTRSNWRKANEIYERKNATLGIKG